MTNCPDLIKFVDVVFSVCGVVMNFVSGKPYVPSQFENFLMENFGIYVDLSSNSALGLGLAGLVVLPFVFVMWRDQRGR